MEFRTVRKLLLRDDGQLFTSKGAPVGGTNQDLSGLVEKVAGSSLVPDTEISKLAGIEAGAEVNVNSDWNASSGDAQILNKPSIPTQYTDEMAQDAVGGMVDTNTLAYTDLTPLLAVKKQMSVDADSSGLKLSGDAETPGNNYVYGTSGAGVKGWKADPAAGAHDLGGASHTADTLANLNAKISDADVVALAGQIGGTAASPDVRGIRETSGATLLTLGAVADNEYLKRSGVTLIGATPPGGSGNFGQATIPFATFLNEDSVSVTGQASILVTSKILASIYADNDDVLSQAWRPPIIKNVVAATGFDITLQAAEGTFKGSVKVNWTWA